VLQSRERCPQNVTPNLAIPLSISTYAVSMAGRSPLYLPYSQGLAYRRAEKRPPPGNFFLPAVIKLLNVVRVASCEPFDRANVQTCEQVRLALESRFNMDGLRDILCGCLHRHTSLPFTSRQKHAAGGATRSRSAATYVVCLDCGREFPYSWEEMRIVKSRSTEGSDESEPHGLLDWLTRYAGLKPRQKWAAHEPAGIEHSAVAKQ
jgi:hypothetical protein